METGTDRSFNAYSRFKIRIELDRDVTYIHRQVYNSFMLLGNVGGLYGILLSIAASFLSVINYGKSENYLIADLFMT